MEAALITGASMGLGVEFARQLAARGVNLALVARSRERMEALAAELQGRHGVRVRVLACDLSRPGAAGEVAAWTEAEGIEPSWLINNAGFGHLEEFLNIAPERLRDCVMVNVLALTELTRLLAPRMASRPGGRIINVASTAGFQPLACFAVYAATKAYVISFSEALHEEWRGRGLRVTTLCPGPTRTNFGASAHMHPEKFNRLARQESHEVVAMALRASDAGRAVCVTQQRALVVLGRFMPRWVVRRIGAAAMRRFV